MSSCALDTGHVPHLSTGFVPLARIIGLRDTSRMSRTAEILLERIRQRREELGITSDRALSLEITGKPDLIRDVHRKGHLPSADNLAELARRLDTSTDWLLGRETAGARRSTSARERGDPWRGADPDSSAQIAAALRAMTEQLAALREDMTELRLLMEEQRAAAKKR